MADLRPRGPNGRRWGERSPAVGATAINGAVKARIVVAEQRAEQNLRIARVKWAAGEVIPDRITFWLDLCCLEGPEVDEQCLAREPEVDLWEAGTLYPSWEQMCALARLVGTQPIAFVTPGRRIRWQDTSLKFHLPDPPRPAGDPGQIDLFGEPPPEGPVLRFTRAALAEAAERYGVRPAGDLRSVDDR